MLSALAVATTGCAEEKPAPEVCSLVAAPAAQPVGGDANGDGYVDVSDGAYLARATFAGGPAPVCTAAIDLVPDGTFNVGDIVAVWYSVGPRSAPYRPEVTAETCPTMERTVEPPCADGLALAVDAPATVSGTEGTPTSFSASVTLSSPALAVEGWSFTLTAAGCTLESGSTAGTSAADKADAPPGLRDGGVAWASVTGSEAKVLTVLDWRTQATLPLGNDRAIHTFTVTGTPVAGCGRCTLTLTAGDPTTGVESVVSAEGWRYLPALGSANVELCPG